MKILIVNDVIVPAGAETFSLRLAEGLRERGHDVTLFALHQNRVDYELKNKLAPDVSLITPRLLFKRVIEKIDGLLFYLNIEFSLLRFFFVKDLNRWLNRNTPDIVHSNQFPSDLVVTLALRKKRLPVITTIHGDYLRYSKVGRRIPAARILNYRQRLRTVLLKLTTIVCITDIQLKFMRKLLSEENISVSLEKIYNGYRPLQSSLVVHRAELNIPEDAFVIGMVARGIKEKGWDELLKAFVRLNLMNTYLVLVGDGPYLQEIKPQYKHNAIRYVGKVTNPIDYINFFDVGCLPSYSENLPTVIIEYLYCNKPVIATNTGEVPQMIRAGTGKDCGILIETGDEETMVNQLMDSLTMLYNDKTLLEELKQNTKSAYAAFDMEACLSAYEKVYLTAMI